MYTGVGAGVGGTVVQVVYKITVVLVGETMEQEPVTSVSIT